MAHIQSFEVLSTKCIWSFDFILINIQLTQFKLNSLAPYCQEQPLLGSHLCWNINHLCSTTLMCLLKSSMPPLEMQIKDACLASKYDLFVKDHVQLQYMH
jgi:hypothetical protein